MDAADPTHSADTERVCIPLDVVDNMIALARVSRTDGNWYDALFMIERKLEAERRAQITDA